MKNKFSFNDFIYQIETNNDNVDFILSYPDKYILNSKILYKYYSLNFYNIDSLLNNYLYACHPYEINDPYDSSDIIIDYSKLEDSFMVDFINRNTEDFNWEEYTNRESLMRLFSAFIQTIRFGKYGIISFSKQFDNILMWAYYGNNKGYCIAYDYSKFPANNLHGPFPINYCKEFRKIEFGNNSEALCFHYQTNVKFSNWAHEDEYRYIAYNREGLFLPDLLPKDKDKRKHKFCKEAIIEIILGFNFFNDKDCDNNIAKFDTNSKNGYLKLVLFEYLTSNKINCYKIQYDTQNKFRFAKRKLNIDKINLNEYKIEEDNLIHNYSD